jgi:hypothetical protein
MTEQQKPAKARTGNEAYNHISEAPLPAVSGPEALQSFRNIDEQQNRHASNLSRKPSGTGVPSLKPQDARVNNCRIKNPEY